MFDYKINSNLIQKELYTTTSTLNQNIFVMILNLKYVFCMAVTTATSCRLIIADVQKSVLDNAII